MDSWTYGVDNNKFPLLNSLKVNKRKIQKKKKKNYHLNGVYGRWYLGGSRKSRWVVCVTRNGIVWSTTLCKPLLMTVWSSGLSSVYAGLHNGGQIIMGF